VYHAGDLVEGKVVGVSERGILVDFGYKSEGIIPAEENVEGESVLSVGDTVEVVIKSIHAGDAPPQLSRTDAKSRKIWNDIEEAYKNDVPVVGKIVDKTKGGLTVDLNGVEAFLPGSQIDSRPIRGLDSYIGQDIEAKIIKFSRRRNNIVLSRKVITDVAVNEQKAETLNKIDIGYVVEGVIKNLTEYGAFVDIGGIDGLLHVTDMSWGRLQNPADHFKVGEHLQVKVLKLDREKEKFRSDTSSSCRIRGRRSLKFIRSIRVSRARSRRSPSTASSSSSSRESKDLFTSRRSRGRSAVRIRNVSSTRVTKSKFKCSASIRMRSVSASA
jgi:small subunit ribosomal protein S1